MAHKVTNQSRIEKHDTTICFSPKKCICMWWKLLCMYATLQSCCHQYLIVKHREGMEIGGFIMLPGIEFTILSCKQKNNRREKTKETSWTSLSEECESKQEHNVQTSTWKSQQRRTEETKAQELSVLLFRHLTYQERPQEHHPYSAGFVLEENLHWTANEARSAAVSTEHGKLIKHNHAHTHTRIYTQTGS